jgi:hypothetical protein
MLDVLLTLGVYVPLGMISASITIWVAVWEGFDFHQPKFK